MKNVLIAQVGMGNYRKTKYSNITESELKTTDRLFLKDLQIYVSGYSFEAVFHEVSKKTPIDTIFLVGTETSRWKEVLKYYGGEDCAIPEMDFKDDKKKADFERAITEQFVKKTGNNSLEQIKIIIIENGINEAQLQRNFDKLQNALMGNSDVESEQEIGIYLDISNGYRSIPMYLFPFVSYMTRILDRTFHLHMYYGMFEAKTPYQDERGIFYQERDEQVAPLVDLNDVTELMEWIQAVNEFRNYGSVKQIREMFKTHKEWNIEVNDKYRISDVFELFDYATNANDLRLMEETIHIIASMSEKIEESGLKKQAKLLLHDISNDFRQRFMGEEGKKYRYSGLTIHLAKWFLDQERIGNAAVALQEGMLTYVMERFPEKTRLIVRIEKRTLSERLEEFLFDYDNRECIKKAILLSEELDRELKAENEFIRHEIRNVSAHIKYQWEEKEHRNVAKTIETIAAYREKIERGIKRILTDMGKEESLFEETIKAVMEKTYKQEWEKVQVQGFLKDFGLLKKDLQNKEIDGVQEDTMACLRTLQEQVREAKGYEETGNFDAFCTLCEQPGLFQDILKLMRNKEDLGREDYEKLFQKKKRKTFTQSFCNFSYNRSDEIYEWIQKHKIKTQK